MNKPQLVAWATVSRQEKDEGPALGGIINCNGVLGKRLWRYPQEQQNL